MVLLGLREVPVQLGTMEEKGRKVWILCFPFHKFEGGTMSLVILHEEKDK